jgi:RHS repeat-associated protein
MPLGTYTYGNSAHLHAATAIGSAYTASDDAAGDLTCRAPSSGATCAGTATGAPLTDNTEGELTAWQNAPTNPTTTTSNLYDGEGDRVEQQVTGGGASTTTLYVGDLEQLATTGGSPTTTTYYSAGGQVIAEAVNGTVSYLASDGLGSATVAVSATGAVQAAQLYAPYGMARYAAGTMPTDYGFTGQHIDAATGLDDYHARYYDPVAGQFASADTTLDGLNRFAYVGGNPTSWTDPSGHVVDPGELEQLINLGPVGGTEGADGGIAVPELGSSPLDLAPNETVTVNPDGSLSIGDTPDFSNPTLMRRTNFHGATRNKSSSRSRKTNGSGANSNSNSSNSSSTRYRIRL